MASREQVPDYSRTAVTVFVEKGFGEGFWRNSCPIDCGWHGSDWVKRDEALGERDEEQKQHQCLRAPGVPKEEVSTHA